VNLRRGIPLWATLCLLSSLLCVTAGVAIISSSTQMKPYTVNGSFVSANLVVNADAFTGYNVTQNRFMTCTVTVYNRGTGGTDSGTVYVAIYNGAAGAGLTIASGSSPVSSLSATASANVIVPLTWVGINNLNDAQSFAIYVTEP
jgi:hypothetical protein